MFLWGGGGGSQKRTYADEGGRGAGGKMWTSSKFKFFEACLGCWGYLIASFCGMWQSLLDYDS